MDILEQKDFSSELSKKFSYPKHKNLFTRIKEGNTHRYFAYTDEEKS